MHWSGQRGGRATLRMKQIWIFLMRMVLFIGAGLIAAGADVAERPPNIILIMADDMGYECIGANGGTSYSLIKEVPFTSERKELMQKFYDTVAAANSKIVGEHKEALKQTMSDDDIDLANRLAG